MDSLTQRILAKIRQMSGRQYRNFESSLPSLSDEARLDLLRLLTDLEGEANSKARRAALMPWRV